MTTMTDDLVRVQHFECDGPVEIDIQLGNGAVEVQLADDDGPAVVDVEPEAGTSDATTDETTEPPTGGDEPHRAVVVEVRRAPRGDNWGLSGLLDWVGGQFGAPGNDTAAERAVRETVIAMDGNRLTVHGPRSMPLRAVALSIVVHAPAGSSVDVDTGSADVTIAGQAGQVQASAGSGDVSVGPATGPVRVKAGSGSARLGPVADDLSVRTGSGDVEVTSLAGNGNLHSGSGDIWLGTVQGDLVELRSGSGDLTVADAVEGMLQLSTGSGDLRVGIRPGVVAELDVVCGSGRGRSDLPVSDEPPQDAEPALYVKARTAAGEALVSRATV